MWGTSFRNQPSHADTRQARAAFCGSCHRLWVFPWPCILYLPSAARWCGVFRWRSLAPKRRCRRRLVTRPCQCCRAVGCCRKCNPSIKLLFHTSRWRSHAFRFRCCAIWVDEHRATSGWSCCSHAKRRGTGCGKIWWHSGRLWSGPACRKQRYLLASSLFNPQRWSNHNEIHRTICQQRPHSKYLYRRHGRRCGRFLRDELHDKRNDSPGRIDKRFVDVWWDYNSHHRSESFAQRYIRGNDHDQRIPFRRRSSGSGHCNVSKLRLWDKVMWPQPRLQKGQRFIRGQSEGTKTSTGEVASPSSGEQAAESPTDVSPVSPQTRRSHIAPVRPFLLLPGVCLVLPRMPSVQEDHSRWRQDFCVLITVITVLDGFCQEWYAFFLSLHSWKRALCVEEQEEEEKWLARWEDGHPLWWRWWRRLINWNFCVGCGQSETRFFGS